MNIAEISANLLTYFSEEQREIPDNVNYPGCNAAVKKAENAALQEIFGKGKPWVRRDERGAILNPPAHISIEVTNGSTTAVIDGGEWEDWFAGCTIVIDGAPNDNQIRNDTAADIRLKFPYAGTTGTQTATVYHDSISVDADVLEVHEPVYLDKRKLHPMNNPTAASMGISTEDYGFHRQTIPQTGGNGVRQTAGTPRWFNVDTWSPSDTEAPAIRLRLFPAPISQGFIEYSVMLKPPVVTDIASTEELPIPFDFIETIYLPIAVKKLRGSSFWRPFAGESEVEDAYQQALLALRESDPKRRSGIRIVRKY